VKTILICGLPGAGKTFLAKELYRKLATSNEVVWFNADQVREMHNDWDFSPAGRHRQMTRLRILCEQSSPECEYAIVDFVCPTKQLRKDFGADFVVWMDTIDAGRFADTNRVFERLDSSDYDAIITEYEWWNTLHASEWADEIIKRLQSISNG
jgi:adenylylsulfate kinase